MLAAPFQRGKPRVVLCVVLGASKSWWVPVTGWGTRLAESVVGGGRATGERRRQG